MKAVWKGKTIAESSVTVLMEGIHYFPPDAVRHELLRPTETRTVCPWKGQAVYYTVDVDGEVNRDAAWSYPEPKADAESVKGYIAFWRGILVED